MAQNMWLAHGQSLRCNRQLFGKKVSNVSPSMAVRSASVTFLRRSASKGSKTMGADTETEERTSPQSVVELAGSEGVQPGKSKGLVRNGAICHCFRVRG